MNQVWDALLPDGVDVRHTVKNVWSDTSNSNIKVNHSFDIQMILILAVAIFLFCFLGSLLAVKLVR